jgi:hypothetical protein
VGAARRRTSSRLINTDTKRLVLLLAAGAVILGSVLPWATVTTVFGTISLAGTEGDGIITLIGGVVAGLAVLIRRFRLACLAFGLTAAIAVYDITNVNRSIGDIDSEFVRTSVGYGLWIIVAAAIVGTLIALARPETSSAVAKPTIAGRPLPPPPPPRRPSMS